MADLFFSEYVEGSSSNKYLEIYNGTGASIDLSAYSVVLYSNGSATASITSSLSGTLANGSVLVLRNSAATIYAGTSTVASAINYNGDDAIALLKNGVIVDVIGQVGTDPGTQWGSGATSTLDKTLRRKASITSGDTNGSDTFDPSIEWDGFALNTIDGLGSYTTSATPTVTIAAQDAAAEALQDPGTFRITRTGSTTSALAVNYTISGTATNGTDYSTLAVTATILAGQSFVDITITPVDDPTFEGSETVILTLVDTADYDLGATTTATVAIADNDASPTPTVELSVTSNTGTEAGTTSITVTATASSAVTGDQTVNLGVTGTGITTGDYNLSDSVITIVNGQTTGSVTFTVVNDADVEVTETAILTISSPSAGISLGTTTTQNITITDNDVAITKISAIQGTGIAATAGIFTIQGIVVGDFQGLNQLGGFYIQEEDGEADNDVLTSEAIFVISSTAVNVGDQVRVTGTVAENGSDPSFNQAVITPTSLSVLATGQQALVTATVLDLPTTVLGDLERYEGMLVTIPETLTVTEVFNLGRFGEVSLSANGRLPNPTNIIDPNDSPASGTSSTGTSNVAAVTAQQNLNDRSRIILDDGSSASNLSDVPYVNTTDGDLTNDTLRVGSTIAGLTGVVGYGFSNYRIQATQTPVFNYEARPTLPTVGGSVKVGSFNVLNYFNGDGLGGGFPTSRGADSAAEFSRQRAKIIAAIKELNADVVGLIEMENDGDGANSAIADLVNGLNAAMGAGTYAFTSLANTTGSAGTDEIKVAFIYKPSTVTPVGNAVYFNDPAFSTARPPLAQTFTFNATGEKFTSIINHFKSKGSSAGLPGDTDQGDGQGLSNATRKAQATALLNFVSQIQTASGDSDVMILGDLNAYNEEDPIDILRAGGFTKLATATDSYVFDGQTGSLDHALVSSSLLSQVTGAAKWNINSSEPIAFDYNNNVLDSSEANSELRNDTSLYSATPFRSSDHDPVLVGLNLRPTNTAPAIGINTPLPFDANSFDSSGWVFGTSTTLLPTVNVATNQASLDTTANADTSAGFFRVDQVLDRTLGYTLNFTSQILAESREATANKNNDGLDDRAGFNAIVIGNDYKGLEIGFFSDRLWVQEGAGTSLFTQAESVSFDTTKQATYTLTVLGDKYTLQAKEIGGNATATLYGVLRDYRSNPPTTVNLNGQTFFPYNTPNFIFLGDDTTSARASFNLSNIAINNGVTAIALPSIAENSANSAIVGSVNATDINGNTLIYSITGGNTNGAFAINTNGQITVANSAALDFETTSSFNLAVGVTDGSLTDSAIVTVNLTDVNEAATNVTLSNNAIVENVAAGTSIGLFNTTDVDSTSFTYSLVIGTGDSDNSAFIIENGTLKINVSPDFETKSSYSIRVQVADGSSIPLQNALTINVIDVNEAAVSNGDGNNNTINGTTGIDRLNGLAGNDNIFGDAGNDIIDGGAGDDVINGGGGADRLLGGTGGDTFRYDLLTDSLLASSDTIINFNRTEGDRFSIDSTQATINNVLNLGLLTGTSLSAAAVTAGTSFNADAFDAVFFKFGSRNYLIADSNSGSVGSFVASEDLFVTIQVLNFNSPTDAIANAILDKSNYFA